MPNNELTATIVATPPPPEDAITILKSYVSWVHRHYKSWTLPDDVEVMTITRRAQATIAAAEGRAPSAEPVYVDIDEEGRPK